MFNSSSDKGTNSARVPQPQGSGSGGKRGMFSVIGPDVVITGNIAATADLHIDGRVDGDVNCGSLMQGADSHIKGTVRAETARLAGASEGGVCVRTLTVERGARITGDVEYGTIAIENGASIDGRLKHISADSAGPATSAAPTTVGTGGVPPVPERHDDRISLVSNDTAA